ncbi:hypothetical protein BROUX41_002758 [Berkeleyomyces rouxiae]|uniref:uncharacterized protein n=1 Tax=Berkeleyomyces rouxiae TaxID=2035830 RepID=UPI003B7DAF49
MTAAPALSDQFVMAASATPELLLDSIGPAFAEVLLLQSYPLLLTTWAGMSPEGLSPASTNSSTASSSSHPNFTGYYSHVPGSWSNPAASSYTCASHQHPAQQEQDQAAQQSFPKIYDNAQLGCDSRFSRSPGSNPENILPHPYDNHPQQGQADSHHHLQHGISPSQAPQSPYNRHHALSLAPVQTSHSQQPHPPVPSPQPPTLTSNGHNIATAGPGQPISSAMSLETYKIQSPIQSYYTSAPISATSTTSTHPPFSPYSNGPIHPASVPSSTLPRGLPSMPHPSFGTMAHYSTMSPIGRPLLSNVGTHSGHLSMIPSMPPHLSYMSSVDYLSHPATPPDRPFRCDQCPQAFNRNHDLKRHKRIHLSVKPFPCTFCDKSFSRKDALKRHRHVKGCAAKATAVAVAAVTDGPRRNNIDVPFAAISGGPAA